MDVQTVNCAYHKFQYELQQAHRALDETCVPRTNGKHVVLSLTARIYWLSGQLSAARLGEGLVVRKTKKPINGLQGRTK